MSDMETSEYERVLAFSPGQVVDERYEIVSLIGAGGNSQIFVAKDLLLNGERIALKLLAPNFASDSRFFARIRNEVIFARRLSHPNIVRTFDFGDAGNGYFFITMELVEGSDLYRMADSVLDRRMPLLEVAQLLFQVTIALDYAHRLGIVHRDIKPENIIVDKDGTVKLTDFGIARLLNVDSKVTGTGELIGTPLYMSPEILRGDKAEPRSDIYALGILAYELVAGAPPFDDESILRLITMHLNRPMPRLAEAGINVPEWFQEFVEVCTEKKMHLRYQSASEASAVLYRRLCEAGAPPKLLCLPEEIQLRCDPPKRGLFSFLSR